MLLNIFCFIEKHTFIPNRWFELCTRHLSLFVTCYTICVVAPSAGEYRDARFCVVREIKYCDQKNVLYFNLFVSIARN